MEAITFDKTYSPIASGGERNDSLAKREAKQPAAGPRLAENAPAGPGSPAVGFDIDPETGRVFIHVRDRESGEIVREIPPEALRKLASIMDEISGNLVDTSV